MSAFVARRCPRGPHGSDGRPELPGAAQRGIRLCRQASAKRLALFHHDPDHDDTFMDQVEADARATWPAAFAAREGMQLEL
jgi:phosphoribosyl 1,2-cyclic phosphodiesterase